jgi:hypothetical protein
MRFQATIILLSLLLGIVVSPSLPFSTGGEPEIGMLDICHDAVPALSSNGDMPCINECSSCPLPFAHYAALETVSPSVKPLLIASQDERPPKA